MSGSLSFNVSILDDPCSVRVTDVIKNSGEIVKLSKRILSFSSTDSHLFVLTENDVIALRLDALRDTPLTASLDISSPNPFKFVLNPETTVNVEKTQINEVDRNHSISSTMTTPNILLASTHSRLFLVDQREEGNQRIYRIFDESSCVPSNVIQLQVADGMGRIIRMVGGADHIVALTEEGRVWAMGSGSHGELGVGSVCSSPTEFIECDLPDDLIIEDIAAGAWHSVVITDSKDVYVWGWNREGQLGEDQMEKCVYTPTPLDIDDVILIDAKECTTVLTTEDEMGFVRTLTYGCNLIYEEDD